MAQDPIQLAAMMELLGKKQEAPMPTGMSPGLVDLIHQETFAPQQQNMQVAGDVVPMYPVAPAPAKLQAIFQGLNSNRGNLIYNSTELDKTNIKPLKPGMGPK